MTKITKLTLEQEQQIAVYRDRYFKLATSTKPIDIEAGKKAALRLAELGGVDNCEIEFVDNPEQGDSLRDSLRNPVWDSLIDSLCNTVRGSLRDPLRNTDWYTPRDTGWLAYYSYAVEVLGVECSDKHCELLKCYTTIAENFTAIWILPGKIILCNKPTNVTVVDGNVTDIQWGV